MSSQEAAGIYPTIGATPPIYIPHDDPPKVVRAGAGYFFIQIKGAQAAFFGSIWERVKRLIITTQVDLNHPLLGNEPLRAIQRSREVQRQSAEQLGLSPNLIKLVPATMSQVSISIEFILDKQNRLAQLGGLINDDTFQAAISLAPSAAMAARTIGGLSQKIIQTFLEPEERQPILQFTGDFNIAGEGLKAGYYVILGTRDARYPIPNPLPKLSVRDGELLADSRRVTQLCYVILDVRCIDARTQDLNDGAPWDAKLRQAHLAASHISDNPRADDKEKNRAWNQCRDLLKEAEILLLADPNYLYREAMDIKKAAYASCYSDIFGSHAGRQVLRLEGQPRPVSQPDPRADRAFLGIPADEDLTATVSRYAEQVADARRILRESKLI